MKRNIDQANLPPPSGLMPRFGRPWMVKKSVNPLRTVQSSQVSGTMATETIADGPELYVQSSLDSAAVGRPSSTPYALPTQDGLLAQRTTDREWPSTQDPAPPSLFIPPWSQVSQPQSQVETEERADTQPTPVTHTATPGSARPSQAAAKLLEEFTCKTLGLADPSAQTQTQTQMLLERLEALESKQEMVLGGLKESIAQHFSDLKTTFSQALQHFKDDVIQHLNTHSRPQHNEASAQEEDECSTHSIHKKANAEDAGGCPGSSCTGTAQAQAQGPVPSAGDGNPKPPSSSSMLSIRSSFKSCISSRNADVYEQSETLNLEGGVARSSSTETEIICILEDEEQESGASEDLPYNFLRHRRPRSGTRSVFLTDDR